jgi:hypothetical protein
MALASLLYIIGTGASAEAGINDSPGTRVKAERSLQRSAGGRLSFTFAGRPGF